MSESIVSVINCIQICAQQYNLSPADVRKIFSVGLRAVYGVDAPKMGSYRDEEGGHTFNVLNVEETEFEDAETGERFHRVKDS